MTVMDKTIAKERKDSWSPYAAGVLLGLSAILAVVLSNHLLGASGAISSIAGTFLKQFTPNLVKGNMYYNLIIPTGLTWEVLLLIGVFFGGMLGAITSRTLKLRWNDDPLWKRIIGPQRWKRWVIGFVGAIIIQYGAGIAGGCTSGLAISGGMLLAPAAFLFMAGMFISGIITALIVYGRRY